MRKPILAVVVDSDKVEALRGEGLSWAKIAEQVGFGEGARQISLTRKQADAFKENGFAQWVGFRRILITSRLEAFTRLSDLSAVVGADVVERRKQKWVGPFLRGQFLKRERRSE